MCKYKQSLLLLSNRFLLSKVEQIIMSDDPYEILQVSANAEKSVIRAAYRSLLKNYHPDLSGDPEASEKTSKINWAYELLMDPKKRAEYDERRRRTTIDFSTTPSRSNNQKHNRSETASRYAKNTNENICELCGKIGQTKYINFYQNIGLLVARRQKQIKGNLCKNCIREIFWPFTIKTLLFGWWGVISFIVSPYFLVNNIIRYIGTFAMKDTTGGKEHYQYTKKGISYRKIILILIFVILPLYKIFSFLNTNSTVTKTTEDNITYTRPTVTPEPVNQYSPTQPYCIRWDRVTDIDIDKKMCVFGIVIRNFSTDDYSQIIRFSNQADTFILQGRNYYYENISQSACIAAIGVLQKRSAGYYYMDIRTTEIYNYNSCK